MAFLNAPINVGDLPEAAEYDNSPIPEGDYTATVHSAEVKPTKDGTGEYIKLRLDITGPTHAKRVIFANINTRSNKSAEAEKIGRASLRSIMQIAGIATLTDTDQLVGVNLGIKVSIRAAKDGYEASNDVRAYKSPGDVAAKAGGAGVPSFARPAAPAAQAPAAAPARSAPPWAAKKA
jgi:hypothetical protein